MRQDELGQGFSFRLVMRLLCKDRRKTDYTSGRTICLNRRTIDHSSSRRIVRRCFQTIGSLRKRRF